jgi:hypothetical protein
MLYRLNLNPNWRRLIGLAQPDLNMKDVEILLRGYAMMIDGDNYTPSMKRFLNVFSKEARKLFGVSAGSSNRPAETPESRALQMERTKKLELAEMVFDQFASATSGLPDRAFFGKATNKFNISVFDAVFAAVCAPLWQGQSHSLDPIDPAHLDQLKEDQDFVNATQKASAVTANVKKRLERARVILGHA